MPDVPITNLLPDMMQYAPGLPRPIAAEHLRKAAITFCEGTRCWRHRATLNVTANPSQIPTPINAVVHEIEAVEFDGRPLEPASTLEFSDAELTDPAGDAPPSFYLQEALDTILFVPLKVGVATLRLFLKPPDGIVFGGDPLRSTIPDFLVSHHARFLAMGALSTALALDDEDFADPNRAASFGRQFQARSTAPSPPHPPFRLDVR